MMYGNPVPGSKKKMETDVFLYARIPEGITSLTSRRTGRGGRKKKSMLRGKNVEWDIYLTVS